MVHSWELSISGKVQGVWYRKFTEQKANELGICGWVANKKDGRVLARIEHENSQVLEMLLHACTEGPPEAEVERIDVRHVPAEGFSGFHIKR